MNFLAPVKITIPKPPFNNYCGRLNDAQLTQLAAAACRAVAAAVLLLCTAFRFKIKIFT
jgi:hypothetical protein